MWTKCGVSIRIIIFTTTTMKQKSKTHTYINNNNNNNNNNNLLLGNFHHIHCCFQKGPNNFRARIRSKRSINE